VTRILLEQGPSTAARLGQVLGLSPAAIRRHLDALLLEGAIVASEAPVEGPRGRGRPAKVFSLTESGRESFPHAYDDLAASALRFLAEEGGDDAVRRFAESRIADFEERYRERLAGTTTTGRAVVLAAVLSEDGYAATVTEDQPGAAVVCQHHCPVQHVAEEFPQLCEAETAVFERLLGSKVERTSTIAHGGSCCTAAVTFLPSPTTRKATR
jgi:predicted ArsR family transcriptional regulator